MPDSHIDIIAQAAGKAWAKQADLLPGIQLQEHQQRIADRVAGPNPRMLVYHGLGSGKSLSALAAAEAAQKLDGGNYGIVAPASLKNNFQKEIKKFTTATPGSSPEVMSYTGLGMGKQFQDQPETLIMDEAARLRNPDSAMTRAAVQAAAQAKRVMLLTGTPITNEPKDLASLISLLNGKQLSPEEFDKQYVGEETVRPSWSGWLQGAKAGVRPIMRNGPKLRSLLEGHVDYQPSKTPEGVNVNEQTIRVPLSPEQDKIQKAIRTKVPPGFLWKLDHEFPLSRQELAKLNSFMTGFRQVGLSTQPFRADKSPLKAFQQSSKMQAAFKNLQTTLDSDPRKKAIIYSNFVDAGLNPYSAGLTQAGIPHGMFTGSESVKNRQAAVDAYNQNKLRALLIGPAGAEGISTKGTSLIQLMDPHWNEARSQQAQGRGLRFDSHTDLPEELKNVAVQRYLSSSEDPSYLGKLMGYKRERTGDEVLSRLTAEKERLNEQFRQILRDAGTKTSAVDICQVSREQLNSASNPRVPNLITTGPAMSSLENMSIAEKCAYITKTADLTGLAAGAGVIGGLGAGVGAAGGGLYGLASGAYQGGKGHRISGALRGAGRGIVGGGLIGGAAGAGLGGTILSQMPVAEMLRRGDPGRMDNFENGFGTGQNMARETLQEQGPARANLMRALGLGAAGGGAYLGHKAFKGMAGDFHKKPPAKDVEEKETSEEEANKNAGLVDAGSRAAPGALGGALLGAGLGGIGGLIAPGHETTYDDTGKVTETRRRSRLMGALRGALATGTVGAGLGAASGYAADRAAMPTKWNTTHRLIEMKSAGVFSEAASSFNPLNSYGVAPGIAGLAALATPTRSLAQQAEQDSNDGVLRALGNVLVPGMGAYNGFKRIGASQRSPEMLKIRAQRAAEDAKRQLAQLNELGIGVDDSAVKSAGPISEAASYVNPVNWLGVLPAMIAAGVTPTRTLSQQASANNEVASNLLIPGVGTYNQLKRIGAMARSPEMLAMQAMAKKKKLQAALAAAQPAPEQGPSPEQDKAAQLRNFGAMIALGCGR